MTAPQASTQNASHNRRISPSLARSSPDAVIRNNAGERNRQLPDVHSARSIPLTGLCSGRMLRFAKELLREFHFAIAAFARETSIKSAISRIR